MSGNEEEFQKALQGKKVPILVLDQKWHRLFAIHGKPEKVTSLESELNALLARQGKLTNELKSLKKLKAQLIDNIVQNMDGAKLLFSTNDKLNLVIISSYVRETVLHSIGQDIVKDLL